MPPLRHNQDSRLERERNAVNDSVRGCGHRLSAPRAETDRCGSSPRHACRGRCGRSLRHACRGRNSDRAPPAVPPSLGPSTGLFIHGVPHSYCRSPPPREKKLQFREHVPAAYSCPLAPAPSRLGPAQAPPENPWPRSGCPAVRSAQLADPAERARAIALPQWLSHDGFSLFGVAPCAKHFRRRLFALSWRPVRGAMRSR
jgi:hypothetical protein